MLLKTIHNNSLIALALVPIIAILLWIRVFFSNVLPDIPFDSGAMPLWAVVSSIVRANVWSAGLSSLFMTLMMGYLINRLNSRYLLLSKQSMLPSVLFFILVAGFKVCQIIHPGWFFALLVILGIDRIFQGYSMRNPMQYVFDATFLFSVGTLFYGRGIYFFPIVILSVGVLRLLTIRSFIASLVGLILPYLLMWGFYFFQDRQLEFISNIQYSLGSGLNYLEVNIFVQSYLILLGVILLFALLVVGSQISTKKIVIRKYYQILIMLCLISSIVYFTPLFSVEIIPLWAIASSILLAHFYDHMNSRFWRELLFSILAISTVAAQILC